MNALAVLFALTVQKLILWLIGRDKHPVNVVTFKGDLLFKRWMPFRRDEWWHAGRESMINRLPWWLPVNAFLHRWISSEGSDFHDHPRWSITIVLRGSLVEHTPWRSRHLRPGSIVLRSRKYIHAFEIPPGSAGKTWTLFIVGRRKHEQNSYVITREGMA